MVRYADARLDWKYGDDVIVVPAVYNEEADGLFDKGFNRIKPDLRARPRHNS